MRLMKQIRSAIVLAAVGVTFAAGVAASPAAPKEGAEYTALPTPQPTDTGKKVEVIEFFAYWCPHCQTFDPILSAWVKKQGDNIVFKRVHVPYNDRLAPQQKLYYALESLGLADALQSKVLAALRGGSHSFTRDEEVFDWVAQNGVDKQKFIDTYRSFGVAGKVRRSSALMESYKVEYWPLLVVDGRWQASPSLTGKANDNLATEAAQQQATTQVLDFLVAKAKAEKK
ncbi:thiol:disulfide interchange protein DsbA/DsbL [Pseudoduganella sp. SL102]|uniref:Thiol:disulfide interchange protein n=1 Tax=Pseudoduganella albidiflava TaxID=321983 RepID=A0A411X493_9BURK|nr:MULTISPECIES: thiol:disulfide interchange protein DsbA/DsbL [Pseudoduganella]QBI03665.1 thiol:disulfide interchange protein DsbA/DsbL [Pseudoduganella albidiflava]WBS03798.1 thiol:disulfide interchange protein DsbA/DsbL [Pseudoduganella sp. SL102]GGY51829.1 thiol:disulfide interchange protein [Pseudoduganella albidiflava]